MKILVSAFMIGLLLVAGAAWFGASEESLWVIVFQALMHKTRFDLMKCIDLYHGPELDALTKQYVGKPEQTYRNENPD